MLEIVVVVIMLMVVRSEVSEEGKVASEANTLSSKANKLRQQELVGPILVRRAFKKRENGSGK